jgi:hypothetical protein
MSTTTTTPLSTEVDAKRALIDQQPLMRDLDKSDRCDRCSAQAMVLVNFPVEGVRLELEFCGHHFRKHESELITRAGLVVSDQTARFLN